MRHTISCTARNRPGVLAKIAGAFADRDINIHSLAVNEAEGEMSAKYDARTYADIAVLDVRELGRGSTIEVRWEEHPKTLRYRRVQYLKAATAVLAGTMCIVVDALPGLVGFLFWIIAIIVADRGRKAERDAFDPIAVVDELLASQSVLPKG